MNTDLIYAIIAVVVPLVELLGILAAIHVILNARTSQSAIAWAISLITFPWLALFSLRSFFFRLAVRSARLLAPIL